MRLPTHMRIMAAWAALVLAVPAGAAEAGDGAWRYAIDGAASSVSAKVRFFGVANRTARFPAVSGHLTLLPQAPGSIDLQVQVNAQAVEADDGLTTSRLRGPAFFDVDRYPLVQFSGQSIRFLDARTAEVTGTLTARGLTRPQVLLARFDADPLAGGGRSPVALSGQIEIDRREYGMTAWPGIVGAKVRIQINGVLQPAPMARRREDAR